MKEYQRRNHGEVVLAGQIVSLAVKVEFGITYFNMGISTPGEDAVDSGWLFLRNHPKVFDYLVQDQNGTYRSIMSETFLSDYVAVPPSSSSWLPPLSEQLAMLSGGIAAANLRILELSEEVARLRASETVLLRDQFASQILNGMMRSRNSQDPTDLLEEAYKWADLAIIAREKKS